MLIFHHGEHPFARGVAFSAGFPFAADEAAGAVFADAGLGRDVPVVDVFAAAVAADVGDAALVVVGGGDAGVAVTAAVVLAGVHEGGEVGVGLFGGWGHAVVGVVGVGGVGRRRGGGLGDGRVRVVGCLREGGCSWWRGLLGSRRCWVAVFAEIVHG